jgi:hypothetical protein
MGNAELTLVEMIRYMIFRKKNQVVVVEARKRICRKLHRSHGACPVECHYLYPLDRVDKNFEKFKKENFIKILKNEKGV